MVDLFGWKKYKVLCLLLIFGLVVLINCKGGGGRGGGGGRRSGSSYGRSYGSGHHGGGGGGSSSDVLLYVILIPLGLICCCGCCYICLQDENKGVPTQTNETFVTSNLKDVERCEEQLFLSKIFQSGTWSCRYFQYDEWHGPHLLSLSFNKAHMTIKGSGTDDVGTFTVDGVYSESARRIGLTEHYQLGTGDPSQNLGHCVTIQVIYNPRTNQFEGKWYVQTHKYQGENAIELKFVEPA